MLVPYNTNNREELKAALAQNFGVRLAESREICGMSQQQAAALLGFANSSRLCKVESSDYGNLKDMYLVPLAVRIFNVSADYLLGLSDHPQREVKQARQQQIQALLADTIANELAEIRSIAKALDEIAELNQQFEEKTREALQALIRFQELNAGYDTMPNGAKLDRLIRELRLDAKNNLGKLSSVRESINKPAPTHKTQ